MTLVELVKMIGNVLTAIDAVLSRADFSPSDPNWQQLYALRKHLDDEQRTLVKLSINLSDAAYTTITAQIAAANKQMTDVIDDFTKVGQTISQIAKIAGWVDQILQVAAKVGV